MNERKISKQQEEAYRICHHDFGRKTPEQAAEVMGKSSQAVRGLLSRMKKIAPQLFPILSPTQAMLWDMWHDEGLSCADIAKVVGMTEKAVTRRVQVIKKKLNYNSEVDKRGDALAHANSYDRLTDDQLATIKRRF
jgi:DNA-directed RNA polymerase specialized sigma24 family protein